MQIQYFKSAWGDIKNSPGWFGKLCLLALVAFIPVFGLMVVFGYLYGWAREIAWGTHEPMPARIFGNDDGKLYRRGWFILVLVFVFSLVPSIVMGIGQNMQGTGVWGVASGSHAAANSILSGMGLLVYLVGLVGAIVLSVLAWIGSMRISIYDRLSAGFQIGKIWKMFRHDTNGMLRIFGMNLLVGLIVGVVLSIIIGIIVFFIVLAGVASLAAAGYSPSALQYHSMQGMSNAQALSLILQFVSGAGIVGFFGMLIAIFLTYLGSVFTSLLVARAMGYWTMQFDVPRWRGQDEPMPFEAVQPVGGAMPVNPAAPVTQASYDAYGQQPVQQPVQQPAWQPPVAVPAPGVAADNAPVAPVRNAEPDQYWQSSQYSDDGDEGQSGNDGAWDVGSEEPETGNQADQPDQDAVAAQPEPQPTIAPGQLSGFTYTGASGVQTPITPSGADPSAATAPDLLVVVPDAPADSAPAESGESDQTGESE